MDLAQARDYYLRLVDGLDGIVGTDKGPWIYVNIASLIDYLAKLESGGRATNQTYRDFVRNYMSQVNPLYSTFTYASAQADLPDQMYFVFRCGIVHAFSLVPDVEAKARASTKGIDLRERSIVIAHRYSAPNATHLSRYSGQIATDACLFIAEDLINDLRQVVACLFDQAGIDSTLGERILASLTDQPPIAAGV